MGRDRSTGRVLAGLNRGRGRDVHLCAAAGALALTVGLAACHPPPGAAWPDRIAGVTFLGDQDHPTKIFQLSADGRAAVGYLFDRPRGAPPPPLVLDGRPPGVHAFFWSEGHGLTLIRGKDGADLDVRAISADGRVAVGRFYGADGAHVFRWTRTGGLEDLGAPDRGPPGMCVACAAVPTAVSADGAIVFGRLRNGSSFRWTRATGLVDLHIRGEIRAAAADGSIAAGERSPQADGERGRLFRWSLAAGYQDLGYPPGADPVPRPRVIAVSTDGATIVGDFHQSGQPGPEGGRAFQWTQRDGYRVLPLGAGVGARVAGVSGDGSQVVGYLVRSGGPFRAVRWVGDRGPDPFAPPQLHAIFATAISADGRVMAAADLPSRGQPRGFLLRER